MLNESVLDLMSQVTVVQLLTAFLLILAIVIALITQKQKILKYLNKWRKTKNEEENFHALVYELKESIKELKKEVEDNRIEREKNRTHDREDSRRIRDEMYKVMNKQSEQIESLTKITLEIQKKNSETKRAEIKEKIERIYRECSPEQVCTEMQFESLKELIDQYEKHGGTNSFVHTTVQPEMYKWKVVKEVRRVDRERDHGDEDPVDDSL